MKRVVMFLAIPLALAAGATGASAQQDEWTAQVRILLRAVAETFEQAGYSATHDPFTGALDDDETGSVTLNLRAGVEYQIVGVCDTDCSDMDLTLFDENGNEIDEDILMDDTPIVTVTPARNGRFRVQVAMADCSAEPCRFGVGAWGR